MIQIKTPGELAKMRQAGKISAGALQAGGNAVKPGVTTADIDRAVYNYIIAQGARPNFKGYNGFPGSACISLNDTVIHGIPSREVVVKEGDIVSIDTGAIWEGFHGDNAATFACGSISPEAAALMEVTKAALQKAIQAAVPGNRVGDISHAVQAFVEAEGYSVVREFVGHGIGRIMHEEPEVPNFGAAGRGPRLVPGMTLAIEPMINQKGFAVHVLGDGWTVKTRDGGLSAHYEHTVAITKDGPVILTVL